MKWLDHGRLTGNLLGPCTTSLWCMYRTDNTADDKSLQMEIPSSTHSRLRTFAEIQTTLLSFEFARIGCISTKAEREGYSPLRT